MKKVLFQSKIQNGIKHVNVVGQNGCFQADEIIRIFLPEFQKPADCFGSQFKGTLGSPYFIVGFPNSINRSNTNQVYICAL